MHSVWTQFVSDEKEKENLEERLIRNKDLFELQEKVLGGKLNRINSVELSPDAFDSPSWAHRQAFFNGYRACMNDIKTLNDHKKEK